MEIKSIIILLIAIALLVWIIYSARKQIEKMAEQKEIR